jgi:hypothetical protein
MGIVVDIFDDLGEENPWIRVMFTHPTETYQWVKMSSLIIVNENKVRKKATTSSSSSVP